MNGKWTVIRDDVSCFGMRRVHLLSADGAKGGRDELILRAQAEGGEVVLLHEWVDETIQMGYAVGMWRFDVGQNGARIYAMTIGDAKEKRTAVDGAIRAAVIGYGERIGGVPNRMVVRKGVIDGDPGEVVMGEVKLRVDVVERGWQIGVVGVWQDNG